VLSCVGWLGAASRPALGAGDWGSLQGPLPPYPTFLSSAQFFWGSFLLFRRVATESWERVRSSPPTPHPHTHTHTHTPTPPPPLPPPSASPGQHTTSTTHCTQSPPDHCLPGNGASWPRIRRLVGAGSGVAPPRLSPLRTIGGPPPWRCAGRRRRRLAGPDTPTGKTAAPGGRRSGLASPGRAVRRAKQRRAKQQPGRTIDVQPGCAALFVRLHQRRRGRRRGWDASKLHGARGPRPWASRGGRGAA
jgi:hypothetical protein